MSAFSVCRYFGRAFFTVHKSRLILLGPLALVVSAAQFTDGWAGFSHPIYLGLGAFLAAGVAIICHWQAIMRDRLSLIYIAGLLLGISGFCAGGFMGLADVAKSNAPILSAPLAAQVAGAITRIDKSTSGKWRITIATPRLSGQSLSSENFKKIRFTLARADQGQIRQFMIGQEVACSVRLLPPSGAILPNWHNPARALYFQQIGAIGYAKKPCEILPNDAYIGWRQTLSHWFFNKRLALAAKLANGTDSGGLLAALVTGERSFLSPKATDSLQASGLAHVISVSGLHVALVYGAIFAVLWRLLALWQFLALRIDVRKIATIAAFFASGLYVLFTGADAPAIRSLLMVGVLSGAVLLNRRAITMRSLAIAALALVVFAPHQAADPGFQMSFLATAGLVALWEVWQEKEKAAVLLADEQIVVSNEPDIPQKSIQFRPPKLDYLDRFWPFRLLRWVGKWLLAGALTSLVATLATAPIAAIHFHRVTPYGLFSNLMAAPFQEFIIAPFCLLAGLFAPLGLSEPFWAVARWACGVSLEISDLVAAWPAHGPLMRVTGFWPPALLVLAIALCCFLIGKWRFLGLLPAILGLCLWQISPKSVAFILPHGGAVLSAYPNSPRKLCMRGEARFDAMRLLDELQMGAQEQEILIRSAGGWQKNCQIWGGGFDAHYLAPIDGNKPILALTIEGKTIAIDQEDAAEGMILARAAAFPFGSGRLTLINPPNWLPAPWEFSQTGQAKAH